MMLRTNQLLFPKRITFFLLERFVLSILFIIIIFFIVFK